jgi:dTDP-4-amino-4,6-dideoxygalactose transaminase
LESDKQDALAAREIKAVFHYLPLNRSEFALRAANRKMGDRRWEIGECPVTEDVSDRLVRLPFYTSMTEKEQSPVIEAVVAA